MTPIRFQSILNPNKYGFEFTGDSMTFWEHCYRNAGALGGAHGYFETLGDGTTQHTCLRAASVDMFTDYCASLASYILGNLAACEGVSGYQFGLEIANEETILFLASVKHNEKRTQWFNLNEKKVSASESKRFDKRWTEVPAWANADKQSAWGLFNLGDRRFHAMELYGLQEMFWQTLYNVCPSGDWEKVTDWKNQIPGDHAAAWNSLRTALRSLDGLGAAKRSLDCCLYNTKLNQAAA